METQLRHYFSAEKKSSFIFISIGSLATVLGLLGLFYFRNPLWTGIAIPLLGIALIQLITGFGLFFRTDRQHQRLLKLMKSDPSAFLAMELPRMRRVNQNFKIYRNVELLLFLLGFFLALMGGIAAWGPTPLGIGIGLSMQSAIMLILDLIAEWRASLYTYKLEKWEA